MRYTLMHISDLHAGPPFNPMIAEQVAHYAHELRPDLLVVSGDMVQRADFVSQWRTIKTYLATLPQPQLIVPGNHDIPLFNVFSRLFFPLRRYRRFIAQNINPVFTRPGLAVVGGCTAHGWTFDGGFLYRSQIRSIERAFAPFGPETCKVVVLHHPVINPPGIRRNREMTNADTVVRFLDQCGVELMLSGHIHVSYVGNTLDVIRDLRQGTIICQSGTTTSRRGTGREHGKNSFNVIEIDPRSIRISQHLYLQDAKRFAAVSEHVFPRRSTGAYEIPRSERVVEADLVPDK
ncbi:MAG: metallophosphoesterase [Chloroflexales bacterium]|nr:metallophosphoesterase [Chloroflexales bacterium]